MLVNQDTYDILYCKWLTGITEMKGLKGEQDPEIVRMWARNVHFGSGSISRNQNRKKFHTKINFSKHEILKQFYKQKRLVWFMLVL
jgi:hypothetical protein